MKFGISDKSWGLIMGAIEKHPEVEKAYIFGSRSMGNYKNGSDVDLALQGKELTWKIISDISAELNERLPLPYFFDVVNVDTVDEEGLMEHIRDHGTMILDRIKSRT